MQRFFITFVFIAITIFCACSSPADKIKGDWEVVSVEKGKGEAFSNVDYNVANEMMRGLVYSFQDDTMFVNGSMAATYVVDTSGIVIIGDSGVREQYSLCVSNDSLKVENEVITLRMKRKSKN